MFKAILEIMSYILTQIFSLSVIAISMAKISILLEINPLLSLFIFPFSLVLSYLGIHMCFNIAVDIIKSFTVSIQESEAIYTDLFKKPVPVRIKK